MNHVVLEGTVVELATTRYTPAGIPLLSFILRHVSQQQEAGMGRRVNCDVPVVVMGQLAESALLQEGGMVRVTGFLTMKSLNSRQLVLHVNELKIIKKGD